MEIKYIPLKDLVPYEKNAKKHPDEQIEHIANSLRQFGFKQPLVVTSDNVVIVGHGRLLAAKKLGLETVPCVIADDLTEDEIKGYRLADNKLNESGWDFELLDLELSDIDLDMSEFGFDLDFEEEEPFDENALNDLFADAPEKEKQPKTIKCPYCSEVFEV